MPAYSTYSMKSVVGAWNHALTGPYRFLGGKIGAGEVTISYLTDQSAQNVSADGSVMTSAIAGDNARISIQAQQTGDLHRFLLGWFNSIKTQRDNGVTDNWASAVLVLTSLNTGGLTHTCRGIAPTKIPDVPYQAEGQMVTWELLAAEAITT